MRAAYAWTTRRTWMVTTLAALASCPAFVRAEASPAPAEVDTASATWDLPGPDPFAGLAAPIDPNEQFAPFVGFDGLRATNCCPMGGWVQSLVFGTVYMGNVVSMSKEVILEEIKFEANFTGTQNITFGIYRETPGGASGSYTAQRIVRVAIEGHGRDFYSSGPLNGGAGVLLTPKMDNGVPLSTFYAIAVGWQGASIDARRDSQSYPLAFCNGLVRGSWGQVGQAPPNPGGVGSHQVDGITFFPAGALSMQMCFREPGGACCLGNASCVDDVTSNGCVDELGGEFLGLYTLCAIEQPNCEGFGACCITGIGCVEYSEDECLFAGGTYKGDGTSCIAGPSNACSADLGACCRYDGFCEEVNRYDCEIDPTLETPGVFRGIGAACDEVTCNVLGACCNELNCTDTTEANCSVFECVATIGFATCPGGYNLDTNGTHCPSIGNGRRCERRAWSEGQPCIHNACLDDVGACCVLGTCKAESRLLCENEEGVWHDAGTDGWMACEANPGICDTDSNGACCLENGGCILTDEAGCLAEPGGSFQGPGVTCSTFICEDGACCYTAVDGLDCVETRPIECVDPSGPYGGSFRGTGTTCPADCFAEGACCFSDGTCALLTESACADLNGIYQGDDSDCATAECPIIGACCYTVLGQERCGVRTSTQCTSLNGRMAGPGTECIPDACQTGGCCELDATCTNDVLRVDCADIPDAVFLGLNSTCTIDNCTVERGACCVEQGNDYTCEIRNQVDCDTSGLVYQGNGVSCDESICGRVACCLPDGTCADLLASECIATNGMPADPGVTCDLADFCTTGACCVDLAGLPECFDDVTLLACDNEGGAFKGGGTVCDANTCTVAKGVCCLPAGACDDNGGALYTSDECAVTLGGTFITANSCVGITCSLNCADNLNSDYDADGDVDLIDFAAFQRCFGAANVECLCPFDADGDGDVDGDDVDGFVIDMNTNGLVAMGVCCTLHGACDENGGALYRISECTQPGATFVSADSCAGVVCANGCPPDLAYDVDGDQDLDLVDLGGLQVCFDNGSSLDCLCPYDMNDSGSVDLIDAADMITQISGPM